MGTKKKFQNNRNVKRQNGTEAMNAIGRAIADKRSDAKDGRIQRKLGTDDTFTAEFRRAFDPKTEHLGILERAYLLTELDAARKTVKAIKKYPDDADGQAILREMQAKPTNRRLPCIHCPIWRHERELRMIAAAMMRYVFPRVSEQLYLVTIVFDHVENLLQLEDALEEAHSGLKAAVSHMTSKRSGVVMLGAFEPDLKSYKDLTTEPKSKSMMRDFGLTPTEAGGWTLTGHFFVRVPDVDGLKTWLKSKYPCSNDWDRVQFKKLNKDKDLLENLLDTIAYADKMPRPLFAVPNRDTKDHKRKKANDLMQMMASAFHGGQLSTMTDSDAFDLDSAILQWAKFVHRMGPDRMYYSVESVHAQKWLSASEVEYLRMTDLDLGRDGNHLYEIHRDTGLFSHRKVQPHLKGKIRYLRSRPLVYDATWVEMTDCEGIDPDTHYHDFEEWLLRPGLRQ